MNATRKWILHRVSAVILAPLFAWFYFSFISLSERNYQEAIKIFEKIYQKDKVYAKKIPLRFRK